LITREEAGDGDEYSSQKFNKRNCICEKVDLKKVFKCREKQKEKNKKKFFEVRNLLEHQNESRIANVGG
jgi:hypothetical protein